MDDGAALFPMSLLLLLLLAQHGAGNSGSNGASSLPLLRTNPFQALGVRKGASDRQIKDAYRKLAKAYHPDKNKDPGAARRFREVKEAYDLLSNPSARKKWEKKKLSIRRGDNLHPQIVRYQRRHMYVSQGPEPEALKSTIRLTSSNYGAFVRREASNERAVWEGKEVSFWLIFVHSFICTTCEQMRPVWEEAASRAWPAFRPADILQDHDSHLVQRLGVRRLPTIVAVRVVNGKEHISRMSIRRKQRVTVSDIMDFATKHMTQTNPIKIIVPYAKGGGSSSNSRGAAINAAQIVGALSQQSSDKVRAVVVSARAAPSLGIAYAAMRIPEVKFFHIDARKSSVRSAVFEALNLPENQRGMFSASSSSSSSLIAIIREDGWPVEILTKNDGLSAHPTELYTLMSKRKTPFVPRVDGSNYFDLCYRFEGYSRLPKRSAEGDQPGVSSSNEATTSSSPSSSSSPLLSSSSSSSSSFCVLSLAGSSKAARRDLLPITNLHPPLPSPLGWISKTRQVEFLRFFKDKFHSSSSSSSSKKGGGYGGGGGEGGKIPDLRAVVALKPKTGEYAVFRGSGGSGSGSALVSWVVGLYNGSLPFTSTQENSMQQFGHNEDDDDDDDEDEDHPFQANEDHNAQKKKRRHDGRRGGTANKKGDGRIPFPIRERGVSSASEIQSWADDMIILLLGNWSANMDSSITRSLWTIILGLGGFFFFKAMSSSGPRARQR